MTRPVPLKIRRTFGLRARPMFARWGERWHDAYLSRCMDRAWKKPYRCAHTYRRMKIIGYDGQHKGWKRW